MRKKKDFEYVASILLAYCTPPFGFCFPLNSFMFPRIINSHFSTGQEVHAWAPLLPASLLCPCCPVTAAQARTMPSPIHTGPGPGSVHPAAGHWEFIGFRQAHASRANKARATAQPLPAGARAERAVGDR